MGVDPRRPLSTNHTTRKRRQASRLVTAFPQTTFCRNPSSNTQTQTHLAEGYCDFSFSFCVAFLGFVRHIVVKKRKRKGQKVKVTGPLCLSLTFLLNLLLDPLTRFSPLGSRHSCIVFSPLFSSFLACLFLFSEHYFLWRET